MREGIPVICSIATQQNSFPRISNEGSQTASSCSIELLIECFRLERAGVFLVDVEFGLLVWSPWNCFPRADVPLGFRLWGWRANVELDDVVSANWARRRETLRRLPDRVRLIWFCVLLVFLREVELRARIDDIDLRTLRLESSKALILCLRDRVAALITRVVSPNGIFFFESGVRVRSDVAVFPKSPALFLADFGDDFIKCLVIFTSGVFWRSFFFIFLILLQHKNYPNQCLVVYPENKVLCIH